MNLNNPRSVERDNQNSLRKFPFSDAASCTNGTCVITPGAIIDAQLYIPGRDPGPVWVSSIDTDGKLHFSDSSGEFAETCSPVTANTAIPVVFTGDGGPVPGGVVVCGNKPDTDALASYGGQEFSEEQTELAPAVLAWPGLPGVLGFLLDDGNTVFGHVKMRGENGCAVSTHSDSAGKKYLQISAIGKTIETIEATGFVKTVIADSDNTNFRLTKDRSPYSIDIRLTGVAEAQDAELSSDQENVCASVRKALGTVPSSGGTMTPDCGDPCQDGIVPSHLIKFMDGVHVIGSMISVYEGNDLPDLDQSNIPDASTHPEERFLGYYDKSESATIKSDMRLYYKYDGSGVGKFTEKSDVILYAHWIPASSHVEVSFDGYGTLHLSAPDDESTGYANPLVISGVADPVPTVSEVSESAIANGGPDAVADVVLHPSVPSGEVTIGIRGLSKAYSS